MLQSMKGCVYEGMMGEVRKVAVYIYVDDKWVETNTG